MRRTTVEAGSGWIVSAAGGVGAYCTVLLGLTVGNASSPEWRDGLVGVIGLALAGLGAGEIQRGPEEVPWYEHEGVLRGW
jgi:hypothetical protein